MKFDSIVLATDFSADSDMALHQAALLQQKYGAKIELVHVFEGLTQGNPMWKRSVGEEGNLKEFVRTNVMENLEVQIEHCPITVKASRTVLFGSATEQVSNHLSRCNADLLMVGRKGHAGVIGMLLGSFTESMCRYSPCNVWIAKHPLKEVPKNVWGLVDLESESNEVVSAIKAIGHGKSTLLHLVDPDLSSYAGAFDGALSTPIRPAQVREDALARSKQRLEQLRQEGGLENCDSKVVASQDFYTSKHAVEQLDKDCELVIARAHKKSRIENFLFGSVARDVATYSETNVVILK